MILFVNWFTANLLMFLTTLSLLGIPIFIAIYAFRKRTGPEADKEAYTEQHSTEG